jgi:hypothetical protein
VEKFEVWVALKSGKTFDPNARACITFPTAECSAATT